MFYDILDSGIPEVGGVLNTNVQVPVFALLGDINKAASPAMRLMFSEVRRGEGERGTSSNIGINFIIFVT